MNNISAGDARQAEVREALSIYFDVIYECDMDKFDRVFHPCSALFTSVGGVMTYRPFVQYRAEMARRKSPKSVGQPRHDEILMLDMISPDIAFAKVRVQVIDTTFTDNLNFLRIGNDWMIVAKIYDGKKTDIPGNV
jgi:hypothetical protein